VDIDVRMPLSSVQFIRLLELYITHIPLYNISASYEQHLGNSMSEHVCYHKYARKNWDCKRCQEGHCEILMLHLYEVYHYQHI